MRKADYKVRSSDLSKIKEVLGDVETFQNVGGVALIRLYPFQHFEIFRNDIPATPI